MGGRESGLLVFQRFHSLSLIFLTSLLALSMASISMLSGTMNRGLAVAHFFMFILTIFLPPSQDMRAFRKGSSPVNTFGWKVSRMQIMMSRR